jgi:esterase
MQLHSLSYGQGEPLFILHGLFGSADNWQTVGKRLAADFHVHALDLRNHGHSPHAPDMDYPLMAADVAEFLDSRNLPSASLLGHSLGGKVAMQFALSSPNRVSQLVVVDVAPRAYPPWHRQILAALQALDLPTLRDRQQADSALAGDIPDRSLRQFLLKSLARAETGAFRWRFNLEALATHYQQLNGALPAAGKFDGPVLFVRGQNSVYLSENDWPAIREKFPAARQEIIAGAGHWVHAEAPETFVAVVLKYLKENS